VIRPWVWWWFGWLAIDIALYAIALAICYRRTPGWFKWLPISGLLLLMWTMAKLRRRSKEGI
jgi:hypothetical protein